MYCLEAVLWSSNQHILFLNLGLISQPKWGHLKDLHAAIKLCEKALVSSDSAHYMKLGPKQEVCNILCFFNLNVLIQLPFNLLFTNFRWISLVKLFYFIYFQTSLCVIYEESRQMGLLQIFFVVFLWHIFSHIKVEIISSSFFYNEKFILLGAMNTYNPMQCGLSLEGLHVQGGI